MDNLPAPTILVVDDAASNRKLLKKTLQYVDAKIIVAESGQEAVRQATGHSLALALVDIDMPEMNGYETAGQLQEQEQNKNCPVIFITGSSIHQNEKCRLVGYETGAVDYIEKPFNSMILLSKVNVFLKLHRQQAILSEAYQKLKQEFEKSKEYRAELVVRLSASTLDKSDLVRSNARLVQQIAELNRENQKLHNYIEHHLNALRNNDSGRLRQNNYQIKD